MAEIALVNGTVGTKTLPLPANTQLMNATIDGPLAAGR